MYPTLLIGIGRTGARGLKLIRKRLQLYDENKLPDGIRLLWIGSEYPVQCNYDEVNLLPSERLVIEPDFDNVEQMDKLDGNIDFDWWYKSQNFDHTSRSDARMGYFWVSQLIQAQQFNGWLKQVQRDLVFPPHNGYRVFILCSLSDYDAPILFDLSYEIRARHQASIKLIVPFFCLGMVDVVETTINYKAFSRELDRLMLNKPKLIDQGERTSSIVTRAIFDSMQFFENENHLSKIVDQILVLLDEDLSNAVNNRLASRANINELNYSLMESFSLFTPVSEMKSYCMARLIKEGLFSRDENLYPYGMIPIQGNGKMFVFQPMTKDAKEYVTDFFVGDYGEYNAYWQAILKLIRDRTLHTQNISSPEVKQFAYYFRKRLNKFFNTYFNDPSLHGYENSFTWAENVVNRITDLFNDPSVSFNLQKKFGKSVLVNHFFSNQSIVNNILNEVRSVLSGWRNAIQSQTVYLVIENFEQSVNRLEQATNSEPGRQCIFTKNEVLETVDKIFSHTILADQGNHMRKLFLENSSWSWSDLSGNISLQWKISEKSFSFNQSELMIQEWQQLSKKWIDHFPLNLSIDNQIMKKDQKSRFNLFDRVYPEKYLDYINSAGIEESLYIIGYDPERGYLNKLIDQSFGNLFPQKIIFSQDPEKISLINFKSKLPYRGIKRISNSVRIKDSINDHIFSEEQNACLIERQIKQKFNSIRLIPGNETDQYLIEPHEFSSDFVRFLSSFPAFELVMDLILYQYIYFKTNNDGSKNWYVEVPNSIIQAFQLYSGPFQAMENDLENAIEQFLLILPYETSNNAHPLFRLNFANTIQTLRNDMRQCNNFMDDDQKKFNWTCIEKWRRSNAKFEKDLAVYQTYLMYKLQEREGNEYV